MGKAGGVGATQARQGGSKEVRRVLLHVVCHQHSTHGQAGLAHKLLPAARLG